MLRCHITIIDLIGAVDQRYFNIIFSDLRVNNLWAIFLFYFSLKVSVVLPKSKRQGWAGMTFGSTGLGTGMDNSIPEVREREGNWKNPFPQFGNGKGMKKNHSQNSGMGREWKNLFPKFGNGKGMKKIHSHNSGTGREWKNPFPQFRNGNQRLSFPRIPGNGTANDKT